MRHNLRLAVCLPGMAVALLLIGCPDSPSADPGPPGQGEKSQPAANQGSGTAAPTDQAKPPAKPPDHLVPVGNAYCPVLATHPPVVEGKWVEYNGWWIALCCEPCKNGFLLAPELYAGNIMEQTGIDVMRPPTDQ